MTAGTAIPPPASGSSDWAPAGGPSACRWCGASAEQRQEYPRPRLVAGLEPRAGECPVCWFRHGRAIGLKTQEQGHG